MIGFDDELAEAGHAEAKLAEAICSRAGCRSTATWNVNWRNPRIHGPERVKIWVACDEHADYLQHYLESRDFPAVVTALGAPLERLPEPVPTERRVR